MSVLFVVSWVLGAVGGCAGAPPAAPEPAPEPAAPAPTEPAPAPEPHSAAALYASCEDRMEQPQAAGECSSDEDCMATGCSREVCTTRAAGTGLATSCEARPCFAVVERCGCSDGTCTWTVGEDG